MKTDFTLMEGPFEDKPCPGCNDRERAVFGRTLGKSNKYIDVGHPIITVCWKCGHVHNIDNKGEPIQTTLPIAM